MTARALWPASWLLVSALAGPPLVAAPSRAPGPGLMFRHLNVSDGLSDPRSRCVLQDRQGFLWACTADGLNRYDGYGFRVFRHDPDDPETLGPGFLTKVVEDGAGKLWVGLQGGGLSVYDPLSETFTHLRHDPADPRSLSDDVVTALTYDGEGTVWVGTSQGLSRVDTRTREVTRYRNSPTEPTSLASDEILALYVDRSRALWIGTTDKGLDRLRLRAGAPAVFEHFRWDPKNPRSLSSDRITSILEAGGSTWVGTWDAGLNRLAADGTVTRYDKALGDSRYERGDRIYDLLEDHTGAIWIAMWGGGLGWLHPETGRFERFTPDVSDAASLSHANVSALFEDRSHLLWVATVGGGLDVVDLAAKPFVRYPVTGERPGGLSAKDVRAVMQDHRGDVWAGTYGDGLNRIRGARNHVERFRHVPGDPHSLADDTVTSLLEDEGGSVWVGTFGGIDRLDPATGRFEHHRARRNDPQSLSSDTVYALHQDATGRLWAGTWDGLNLLDRKTGRVIVYRKPGPGRQAVLFIGDDPSGALWLGMSQELVRFQPETGAFDTFASDVLRPDRLGIGFIWCMLRDASGRFWLGSSQGLHELLPSLPGEPARLRHFGSRQGLPDAAVVSIQAAEDEQLWLGTTRGLVRFEPRHGIARRYDTMDGLPDESFNTTAAFRAQDGSMFFGTTGGLTSFDPSQFRDDPIAPRVVLSALRLSHRPVPVGPDSVLERALFATEAIELPYDARIFGFDFTALSFRAPHRNRFRYRLDGFDAEWHETADGEHGTTYTNLAPGSYVFRVRGSNSDGVWDESGASVKIRIRPPWWKTWWLRTLAVLAVAAGLLAAHRLRTRGLEARSARLEREMRDREGVQRALSQSAQQLRLIADAVPFVIAYVDAQGRIRFANRAAEQWAGRPRSEIEGREIDEILPLHVLALVRDRVEMAQGGERVAFDFAVGARASSRRRIAATFVPHAEGDAAVPRMGFYAFAEDVTERVRTQEELHRQHDQIAHASRVSTLGEMGTAIAHELNQPLTAVLSNANAVLRTHTPPRGVLPEGVEEALRDIAEDATRAGEIIRHVRELVRKGASRKAPLDVNEAIRGVETLIRAAALEGDAALFMDLAPGRAMSVGDVIQVQQVVLNLVRNAIDAMRALPKPERRLVVRSQRDRDVIVVSVEDAGPPLEKEALDHLFAPFYTTKANGLGMGLSISRSIIEAHGGVIEARSRSGRGLAVRFTLRASHEAGDAVGPRMSA